MGLRLKLFIILINVALVAGGIVFIFLGTPLWNEEQMVFIYTSKLSLGGVIIGTGTFLCLVAACGAIGAMVDFVPLLIWYIAALLILFVIQIGTAIVALLEVAYADGLLTAIIEQSLQVSFNSRDRFNIGRVQQHFKCCGIHNAHYWIVEQYMDTLPLSCCRNYICHWGYFGNNCLEAVTDSISKKFTLLAYILIAFGLLELVGCCFAVISHRSRKRGKDQTG